MLQSEQRVLMCREVGKEWMAVSKGRRGKQWTRGMGEEGHAKRERKGGNGTKKLGGRVRSRRERGREKG